MEKIKWTVNTIFEKDIRVHCLISVLSVCFLLFYSAFSSPLYPDLYAWDAAIFMLGGKIVANGGVMYIDYFDHKGPLVFFIHAIGYKFLGGRTGVFLIQIILFNVSTYFMYKTAKLFIRDNKRAFGMVFFSAVWFGVTFENGALTEELSLPFILCIQYLILSFFKEKEKNRHKLSCGFLYGVFCAIMSFIRITNLVSSCVMIMCVAVGLIAKKEIKNFLENICAFLLGSLCVVIPIFLYFHEKNAVNEMLFGTFGYSTGYALAGLAKGTAWMSWLMKSLPLIATAMAAGVYTKKESKEVGLCVCVSGVMTILSLCLGGGYMHYFTLTIPLCLVGLCMMHELGYYRSIKDVLCNIKAEKKVKKRGSRTQVCLTVLLIFSIVYYGAHLIVYSGGNLLKLTTHYYMEDSNLHKEQVSVIPESEKKSVLAYNLPAKWYMETDILPCFRYAFFQEKFRSGIPEMDKEFEILLKDKPPRWLAVTDLDQIQMKIMKTALYENYELISEVDDISLFRFIDKSTINTNI